MKRIIAWLSVIFALGAVPMLMGPTGGYPSRPTFQSVAVVANGGDTIRFSDTAQGADAKHSLLRGGSGGRIVLNSATDAAPTTPVTNAFAFLRTGAAWSSVDLGNATDVPPFTVNGITVTPLSGTFTSNPQGTGCTSSTLNISYKKMSSTVVLKVLSRTGFPTACSGGTMLDNSGAIPAALRPTTNTVTAGSANAFTNNAVTTAGCLIVNSSGNLNYGVVDSTGCNSGGWTGVGNRDFGVGSTFVYSTD